MGDFPAKFDSQVFGNQLRPGDLSEFLGPEMDIKTD